MTSVNRLAVSPQVIVLIVLGIVVLCLQWTSPRR
jgi:hypothetical protein